jgi:hypothetical protein
MINDKYFYKGVWVNFFINKSSFTLSRIYRKNEYKLLQTNIFWNNSIMIYDTYFLKGLCYFFLINKSPYTLLRIFWKYE